MEIDNSKQHRKTQPKYKKVITDYITYYKSKHGKPPLREDFTKFIKIKLAKENKTLYKKIHQYISQFCVANNRTNINKYPKKYLIRINERIDIFNYL